MIPQELQSTCKLRATIQQSVAVEENRALPLGMPSATVKWSAVARNSVGENVWYTGQELGPFLWPQRPTFYLASTLKSIQAVSLSTAHIDLALNHEHGAGDRINDPESAMETFPHVMFSCSLREIFQAQHIFEQLLQAKI